MGQITVFSGPERRRRWSVEQRLRILAEAFAPGASVSDVARRYDLSTGQIYTWRKRLTAKAAEPVTALDAGPGFAEAVVIEEEEGPVLERLGDGPPKKTRTYQQLGELLGSGCLGRTAPIQFCQSLMAP